MAREGFGFVVDNAFAGLGFAAESAKHAFPLKMFLPGSDLSPLEQNIGKVIEGLGGWRQQKTKKRIVTPPPLEIGGATTRTRSSASTGCSCATSGATACRSCRPRRSG